MDRALRIEHARLRAAYPRDQHGFPSTPSTRLTRLASLPRVCRSYLFYDGASTLIREAFSQYYSAEPQVAPQEARSPRGAGPMREKCGPHSQGSRRCRARSQQLGSLLGCAAERATALGCFRLAFGQPVQFGHRCLVCPCAHAERSTHACSVPRFAVVTRSESVTSVRFRSCSCVRCAESHDRCTCRTRVDFGPR